MTAASRMNKLFTDLRLGPTSLVVPGFLLAALVLAIPVIAKLAWGVPPEHLLRDGVSTMEAPVYIGTLSNLGLILWGSAATLCFLSAATERDPEYLAFWRYAGILTLLLLADDMLLIHDHVFPRYAGISEYFLYAFYAFAMLGYVVRFRQLILAGSVGLLLAAFAGFAVSLGVDRLDGVVAVPALYFFEDGAKLAGIVAWLLFHGSMALAPARVAHS